MKALIVDDKLENLYMLESLLKASGFETVSARNGAEALGLARKDQPDLIISDILMPLMDGYTLCRECKRDEMLSQVPFIFYTATYTDPKDEEFALKLGADRFLLKPLDPDEFLRVVVTLLEEKKKTEAKPAEILDQPEMVVLKEYNEVLIRKLEDKMRQTEENEKNLKKYIQELENTIKDRNIAQEAKFQAESKYRTLFMFANDGIIFLSNDSFVDCNPKAAEMFGYSPAELITFKPYELSPPHQPDGKRSDLAAIERIKAAHSGEPQFFEWKHKRRDGSLFDVEVSLSRIEIDANMLLLAVVRDISDRKRTERAILEAEERFRSVFENTVIGLYRTTPAGKITMANPALLKMLGYSSFAELSERNLENKGFENSTSRSGFKELLKTNDDFTGVEFTWLKADGTPIYIRESAKAFRNAEGEIVYYQGAVEDITEQKNAEIQFRSIWENSLDGMRLLDENGIIIRVNDSFCKLIETSPNDLVGKPFNDLFSTADDGDQIRRFIERFQKRQIMEYLESEIELHNGKKKWVSLSNSFIEIENGRSFLLSIFRDITEKKQMLKDLMAAKEKAEEMNRVKSSFFANMSHELRTPLIGVLGFSEILEGELEGNQELRRMAQIIHTGGERLMRTLNFILNVSKLEAERTQVNLQCVNIVTRLKAISDLFAGAAKTKRLQYEFIADRTVIFCEIDEALFEAIFDNLLNNALRFTETGGISIKVHTIEGEAIIEIRDTGVGIPLEKQDVIWEEFRQASEGLSRSYEGTGLGLTIAKKYTELMRGSISVHSLPGSGATFTVRFPIASTSTHTHIEESVSKQSIVGKTPPSNTLPSVLYVEDDPVAVDVVQRLLSVKYEIDIAADGLIALQMAKTKSYNLVLMDINLSRGLDGVQVTAELRKMDAYKSTPIVAVTAYAMEGDKEEFLSKGMTHYISKPFTGKAFLQFVQEVIAS